MPTDFGDRWTRLAVAALAAVGIGLCAAGCLGLDVGGTFRWPNAKTDQPVPARMTVAWRNDLQKKNGKNLLRGFEGKLQFFAADPPKPADKDKKDKDGWKKPDIPPKGIPVDGTVTVYAFEETPDGKEAAGPAKKYVFPPKELKRVHREGPQGHEYNIWLACDKVGGVQKHVRLLVRFDPTGGGQVVMSDNSREVLPGLTVQYASGQSPELRKAPASSAGHPVSPADFGTEPDANRDSKSADPLNSNQLDGTR